MGHSSLFVHEDIYCKKVFFSLSKISNASFYQLDRMNVIKQLSTNT